MLGIISGESVAAVPAAVDTTARAVSSTAACQMSVDVLLQPLFLLPSPCSGIHHCLVWWIILPSKPKLIQPGMDGVDATSDGVSDWLVAAGKPRWWVLCCMTQASEGHSVEEFTSAFPLG